MGQDIGINEQRGRRRNATIQRREWHRGSVADSLATGSCPGHGLLAARDRGARSCPCSARSGGRAEAKARLIRIENLFGAVRVPLSKSAALDEVCITCARYGASRRWGCQCSLTLDSTVQTISATISRPFLSCLRPPRCVSTGPQLSCACCVFVSCPSRWRMAIAWRRCAARFPR